MALVYCKACGKEISENAKACPSCGEPQKTRSNAFLIIVILVVLIVGGFIGFKLYNTSLMSEAEQKKMIVQEILGKDCTFLSQAGSEFIQQSMVRAIVTAAISNRCDCVQEVIVPEMVNNYSLEELEKLKDSPIEAMQAVGAVVTQNLGIIQQHCGSIN
ncbi:MAG: zinc-ribbon domain [Bacteroidetes bacterium]|nr:zinc-ribbon domain [Bacteroidota bacterium]